MRGRSRGEPFIHRLSAKDMMHNGSEGNRGKLHMGHRLGMSAHYDHGRQICVNHKLGTSPDDLQI